MNNIDTIKSLLKFDSEDDFYHLQILKRKKEHPTLSSNTQVMKTYYIYSFEYLDLKMSEIINLCEFHNARACINLNKRSFEKIAFHTLKKVTDCILSKDYKAIRKAYDSVCGSWSNEHDNKKWIVDIDQKDNVKVSEIEAYLHYILNVDKQSMTLLPTKNGFHLITPPFRLDMFKKDYPDIDVHKDNPTLLYFKEN